MGGEILAFCNFGKDVKKRLIDLDKTQKWLMEQIAEETGLYVDGFYLYKILAGQRKAPKITAAIRKILNMEEATADTSKEEESVAV